MSEMPYDDWRRAAAREILEAVNEQRRMQAYHDSGRSDGWARQHGARMARPEDVAQIIDKHYQNRLRACVHGIAENRLCTTCPPFRRLWQ